MYNFTFLECYINTLDDVNTHYNWLLQYYNNKDDNIHKSSEMVGQMNINTCRVSKLNKQNINLKV